MEPRFQYIFLASLLTILAIPASANKRLALDNEYFEFGVNLGVINVQDFTSEFGIGLQATFSASENFFLQFNFLQADIAESSFEAQIGQSFSGSDRQYRHYDLLVGYNIFDGEIFLGNGKANLSSLYVVGGFGSNQFGGEEVFSSTLGLGYKIGLTRKINLHVNYRNYLYNSSLVLGEREQSVRDTHFSVGLGYLW